MAPANIRRHSIAVAGRLHVAIDEVNAMLPTAKRFIEAHIGQIAIDCPPDGGTTVVVRIPMSAS